jgi:hypothetical protein
MRARDAVGRTITEVRQSRHYDHARAKTVWSIDRIELDDGSSLVFHPSDDGNDLYVSAQAVRG